MCDRAIESIEVLERQSALAGECRGALAQRTTAPKTIYWAWSAADPRALPFGPFIDRNHLATWLVLTISVVGG